MVTAEGRITLFGITAYCGLRLMAYEKRWKVVVPPNNLAHISAVMVVFGLHGGGNLIILLNLTGRVICFG